MTLVMNSVSTHSNSSIIVCGDIVFSHTSDTDRLAAANQSLKEAITDYNQTKVFFVAENYTLAQSSKFLDCFWLFLEKVGYSVPSKKKANVVYKY